MSSCARRTSSFLTFLHKTELPRRGRLPFALVLFFTVTEPWRYSGDRPLCKIAGEREIKIKQEGKGHTRKERGCQQGQARKFLLRKK